MIRLLFLIGAVLTLMSCDSAPPNDTPTAAEAETVAELTRPTVASKGYDPYLAIRGLDPQWSDRPLLTNTHYTASLGLNRESLTWPNTNMSFDRTDYGGVYMISIRSGMPERCSAGPDLMLAFDQYASDLGIAAQAQGLKPKVAEAWASGDGWFEAEVGRTMIRAIGGCPRSLVIKAIENAPTSSDQTSPGRLR